MIRSSSFFPSSPLSGIIDHLTSRFCGNVHDRCVINITANRPYNDHPSYAPKNVADLATDSSFGSANEPNQSICFDFKEMQIRPTHYSIRMSSAAPNAYHLKNWVIEGSVDGNLWLEIDRRENNTDLNGSHAIKTFNICKVDTFRMIRLRQIGLNHRNDNYLLFTAFEFFGSLIGLK
jgi:hypothetical protein